MTWRAKTAIAAVSPWFVAVVIAATIIRGVGISWGLPASDAWDNDGVAPRDFLPGLAATFSPGEYYTYPPLHLVLLAIVTAPITIIAAWRAGSTSIPEVLKEILQPMYMTAMSATARLVSLAMSVGILFTLGLVAEEVTARSESKKSARLTGAAIAVAAFAAINAPFTYYAKTSNLDVPYFFWACLAVLGTVRAIRRQEPRRLRWALVFAALAVATKDQAYAMFLLGVPFALGAWLVLDPWAKANARTIVVETFRSGLVALAVLLVVDGALFNPSGFRARLGFLAGSASQDFAMYSRDFTGRMSALADTFVAFRLHYPPWLALFVVGGIVVAVIEARKVGRSAVAATLVPLAVALSFTLCFNLAARRVEERFTLPQMLLAAHYGGFGLASAWRSGGHGIVRIGARALCAGALVLGVWQCLRIDVTMLDDPRYQTEAFLAEVTHPIDTIEVHGLNVYLPRFFLHPPSARVERVGPTPPARRGPIPGVEEVEAPFSDIGARNPRFVVASECYVWRYLPRDLGSKDGRIVPITQSEAAADPDATRFFRGLFDGSLGYRVVHEAKMQNPLFERAVLHGSLGCSVFTFERAR